MMNNWLNSAAIHVHCTTGMYMITL